MLPTDEDSLSLWDQIKTANHLFLLMSESHIAFGLTLIIHVTHFLLESY